MAFVPSPGRDADRRRQLRADAGRRRPTPTPTPKPDADARRRAPTPRPTPRSRHRADTSTPPTVDSADAEAASLGDQSSRRSATGRSDPTRDRPSRPPTRSQASASVTLHWTRRRRRCQSTPRRMTVHVRNELATSTLDSVTPAIDRTYTIGSRRATNGQACTTDRSAPGIASRVRLLMTAPRRVPAQDRRLPRRHDRRRLDRVRRRGGRSTGPSSHRRRRGQAPDTSRRPATAAVAAFDLIDAPQAPRPSSPACGRTTSTLAVGDAASTTGRRPARRPLGFPRVPLVSQFDGGPFAERELHARGRGDAGPPRVRHRHERLDPALAPVRPRRRDRSPRPQHGRLPRLWRRRSTSAASCRRSSSRSSAQGDGAVIQGIYGQDPERL